MIERFKRFALEAQKLFFFSLKAMRSTVGRPIYPAETLEQMYLVGIGSLFLIILTGISAGQAMALQFSNELAEFGSKAGLLASCTLTVLSAPTTANKASPGKNFPLVNLLSNCDQTKEPY